MLPGRRSDRRGVARSTAPGSQVVFAVALGNMSVLGLGTLTAVIGARALAPEARGEFVATQTWASMAAVVFTFGVTQAVVTYRGAEGHLAQLLALQAVTSFILGLLLCLLLRSSGAQPWLGPWGVIGGAAITSGGLITSLCAGVVQRRGGMSRDFQLVRLAPQVAGLIVIVGLWLADVQGSEIWLAGTGAATLLISATQFLRLVGPDFSRPARWRPQVPQGFVGEAATAFVTAIGAQVVYRLDLLLVGIMMSPIKTALYAVAVSAGVACASVGQAVGMVTFSQLARAEPGWERWSLIQKGVWRAAMGAGVLAIPIALLAQPLIRAVYGIPYEGAAPATRVLVLAAIPLSIDYLLIHALLATRAKLQAVLIQALMVCLTTIGLVVAINSGHLVAVAAVSVGVYCSSSALMMAVAWTRRKSA